LFVGRLKEASHETKASQKIVDKSTLPMSDAQVASVWGSGFGFYLKVVTKGNDKM
jgi:hypothetical protein